MATPVTPLYTVTERYLDVVEKGQKIVLELVEKSASRVHGLTPDQVTALVAAVTPSAADVDRGYALVDRAVSLGQTFSRDLAKALVGAQAVSATSTATPKRAA